MKLFCANSFTGEDPAEVSQRMQAVVAALEQAGHGAYCPVFDPHKIKLQAAGDVSAIFSYAFENIRQREGLVVIATSSQKSEGMLMEIGAALMLGKPVYLFAHAAIAANPSHVPKLATKVFTWATLDELSQQLQQL